MRKFQAFVGLLAIAFLSFAQAPAAEAAGCLPGVLKQRLNQIRKNFGPVRVVSTFRRGARIAGTGKRSYHASCRAVDFLAPSGKYRAVVAWLKRNHAGGVGTYSCGMHHIHIDNGPRVRYHHCVTASGRPRSRGTRMARRARKNTVRIARQRRRLPRVTVNRSRAVKPPVVSSAPARNFNAIGHFSRNKLNGG